MRRINLIFQFLLLFSFFTGISAELIAQKLLPGYILLNSKDTLTGYILTGSTLNNSHVVKFKKHEGDEAFTKYSPEDIKEYKAGELRYVSFQVYDSELEPFIFGLEEVKGKISLYSTLFKGNQKILILKKDQEEMYLKRGTYNGLMPPLFEDCPYINTGNYLKDQQYNLEVVKELVSDYNACRENKDSKVYTIDKPVKKIHMGVKAGAGSGMVDLIFPTSIAGKYNKPSYAGGLMISYPLTKIVSIQPEIFYSVNGANGSIENNYITAGKIITDFEITTHFVSVPLNLKFDIKNRGKINPYLLAGGSLNFKARDKGTITDTPGNTYDFGLGYTKVSYHAPQLAYEFPVLSTGVQAAAGVNLKLGAPDKTRSLTTELRFSQVIVPADQYIAKIYSYHFMVGYFFR